MQRHEFGVDQKRERRPESCVAWAELLPDAAEGLLTEAEARALETHVAGCSRCAQELADARRGVAWLGLLKEHTPEPPADLLANILAQTTGSEDPFVAPVMPAVLPLPAAVVPAAFTRGAVPQGAVMGFRARLSRWLGTDGVYVPALQPRLAMTAAMAFLSVCLTLNLLGVSVHDLRAQTLRPATIQRALAGKGASLLRSVQGIRTVYRVESRVSDFLTASASQDENPVGTGR